MRKTFVRFHLVVFLSLILALIIGCENDYPPSLYDPNVTGKPAPQITSMSPPSSALAGVTVITISGSNFSSKQEENFVYFGSMQAELLFATEAELKVRAPNLVEDSIVVRVAVSGSELFSNKMLYRLDPAVEEYSDFTEYDDVYGIDCDRDENIYVFLIPRKIEKVTPDGQRQDYGTTSFLRATQMRMGPGGYLYLTRSTASLYRIPPGGGSAELFATAVGRLYDLDFDQGGNLFTAGEGDSLYLVRPDGTTKAVAAYPGTYLRGVRVFNGYVYVAGKVADGQEAVWRNQIISAESLGSSELVFDWSGKLGSSAGIRSLTFAADGDMYLGTDGPDAIVVVHADGTHELLYPGVLAPESYAMAWGNGIFLYVNRRNVDPAQKRIIRINMQKDGAPYYGRQ